MIIIEWTISSISNLKTMIVVNDRKVAHTKYKKTFIISKRYAVHSEDTSKFSLWDKVSIVSCKPISKTKKWIIKQ